MIRVLVVEDTALFRKVLVDLLSSFDDVEVVGSAPNGRIGLKKVDILKPDLVTLDIEMPELNGVETLKALQETHPELSIVMVSANNPEEAQSTLEALQLGALDFIEKPTQNDSSQAHFKNQFSKIVNILRNRQLLSSSKTPLSTQTLVPDSKTVASQTPSIPTEDTEAILERISKHNAKIDLVAIGVSTGGPASLPGVLAAIPSNFKVPILIVQHMPESFTGALVESLNQKTSLNVVAGVTGMALDAGKVILAPGGKQMKLVKHVNQEHPVIEITDDPPVSFCKPSVDYLFRSIATHYDANVLGVIMTGMGNDGALGVQLLKRQGATIFAQDEASSVVYGMPMEAAKTGAVDQVLPLDCIANAILKQVRG